MAEALARSGRELIEDEVFDFLTDAGYMERKRYSDIERLITYAKELRERRK
jgi:DNA-binding MltR family transcriptional regulator